MKSRFEMGWVICMFDLPTVEREESRSAQNFRKGLLEHGFLMLQESVYARNCVNKDKYPAFLREIRSMAPTKGLINVFFITDKQWLDSDTVICENLKQAKKNRRIKAAEKATEQMTFW